MIQKIILARCTRQSDRQLFIGGVSSAASLHEPRRSAVVICKNDVEQRALAGARITPVLMAGYRIDYPPDSNYAHLPKIVFHNSEGETFYSQSKSIGVAAKRRHSPVRFR